MRDNKGRKIPPWDNPRLSPEMRRIEWLRGHIKPQYLRYNERGVLVADMPKVFR